MDKRVLEDYIDACEFIKETEAEIKKLEMKKRFVQDKVRGSNPDWPYEERSFSLGGSVETAADAFTLAREKRILEEQRKVASDLKLGVEEWMKEIPFRMQRIIRYKFFNRLSWEEVAMLMGRKCTAGSVRMEYQRFMEEN
ncbi:RNA polymerase subunit sigma-70 [Sellimonas intestinalis]|uniref:RNA polymerase subunit sigma-70 n=1 Tax=Sellimonas intestinalis TaxID=1653434 RepID=UPI0015EBFA62|nr:RNA polymerase subunit sigma-70 [Sellimonas intestinalis]MBA2215232.1 RNA polymerase subunit sigma-70 [Sellimonas intestinalis]